MTTNCDAIAVPIDHQQGAVSQIFIMTMSDVPQRQYGNKRQCTIIWEMFVVKIFSWGRRTSKMKRTNIYLQ